MEKDTLWTSCGVKCMGQKFFVKQCLEIRSSLFYIKFDDKSTRRGRLDTDKFTRIREIFEKFSNNCATKYTPTFSLTIDEQLMPIKNCCPFIIYIHAE